MMYKRTFKFKDDKTTARFINLTKALLRSWSTPDEVSVWAKNKTIIAKYNKLALKCKCLNKAKWEEDDKKG